jgi:hypothetical protein
MVFFPKILTADLKPNLLRKALIIPSANPDDPPLQARSTGEAGHKAFEKSGPYPRLPKVADDVIEALRNISLLLPTRQTEQRSATLVIICVTHMQGEYSVILTEPISCPEGVPSI